MVLTEGFNYTVEGTPQKPKPGFIATAVGSRLRMLVDTERVRRPRWAASAAQRLQLHSGCSCATVVAVLRAPCSLIASKLCNRLPMTRPKSGGAACRAHSGRSTPHGPHLPCPPLCATHAINARYTLYTCRCITLCLYAAMPLCRYALPCPPLWLRQRRNSPVAPSLLVDRVRERDSPWLDSPSCLSPLAGRRPHGARAALHPTPALLPAHGLRRAEVRGVTRP